MVQKKACPLGGAKPFFLTNAARIVNCTVRNKLQWNFKRNSNIFIQVNAPENGVCEMASILTLHQSVSRYFTYFTQILAITVALSLSFIAIITTIIVQTPPSSSSSIFVPLLQPLPFSTLFSSSSSSLSTTTATTTLASWSFFLEICPFN